ncbi:hypothetical protein K501DRAFT_241999 [Backusella circina FSU 941]|nr:hypothetical protein K501DRAFT_241999 [Backusella circina FSU 941]
MKLERVCCCIPVRLGVFLISLLSACVYIVFVIIMFIYRKEMEYLATSQQIIGTPFTVEAFNAVFYSFISIFIASAAICVFGLLAILEQHRRMARIYNIVNWVFVLTILIFSLAWWIYLKVKQADFLSECQISSPLNLGDSELCIDYLNKLVIISGVLVFAGNLLQLYWAKSISKYSISLNRYYQHQRLTLKDEDASSHSES